MTEDNRIENANVEVAKALASLAAADHLIAMGLRDDAMSRLYYAFLRARGIGPR